MYTRVIPRDFFNEAKTLKCMGQLALKILESHLPDGVDIEIGEIGEPFEIRLDDDGFMRVANYTTTINGVAVIFRNTYNSRYNYPFYCYYDGCDYDVFDENGEFTQEFIEFAKEINAS